MRLRIAIRGRVRPSLRPSVCSFWVIFKRRLYPFLRVKTKKSSIEIINNDTSYVPPRYLLNDFRGVRQWASRSIPKVSWRYFDFVMNQKDDNSQWRNYKEEGKFARITRQHMSPGYRLHWTCHQSGFFLYLSINPCGVYVAYVTSYF